MSVVHRPATGASGTPSSRPTHSVTIPRGRRRTASRRSSCRTWRRRCARAGRPARPPVERDQGAKPSHDHAAVDHHAEGRDQHHDGAEHAADQPLAHVGQRGVVDVGRRVLDPLLDAAGRVGVLEAGPDDRPAVEVAHRRRQLVAEVLELVDGCGRNDGDDGGERDRQAGAHQRHRHAPRGGPPALDRAHDRRERHPHQHAHADAGEDVAGGAADREQGDGDGRRRREGEVRPRVDVDDVRRPRRRRRHGRTGRAGLGAVSGWLVGVVGHRAYGTSRRSPRDPAAGTVRPWPRPHPSRPAG